MPAARLATGAHHTWLGYWYQAIAESRVVAHRRHVAHFVTFVRSGRITSRWVTRSVERHYQAAAGTVRFYPADHEQHAFFGQPDPVTHFYTLVIPPTDQKDILASEGIDPHTDSRHLHLLNDAELVWCIKHLASHTNQQGNLPGGEDEAARRLILRLAELSGGKIPEWHADGSTYDRRTFAHLLNYVDAHLKIAPCLSDLSTLVGLSPSHFARKFRQTTGLSLHRFINRRRIRASLELLKDQSQPLTHVALELGFSSQSHFTRLFSELTGMTPAKYRKQFRRIVG